MPTASDGQFVDPFGILRHKHNGQAVAATGPSVPRNDSVAALAAISRGGNPARAELEECGIIRPRRVKTTKGR